MKKCTKCGKEKSLDDFHIERRSKDSRYPQCKVCKSTATRIARQKIKEVLGEAWYERNVQYNKSFVQKRLVSDPNYFKRKADSVHRLKMSRLQDGMCYRCGRNNKLPLVTHCEVCTVERIVSCLFRMVRIKYRKRQNEHIALTLLKKLHDNPFCPFTGEPIALGDNAELDHIVPRSRRPDLTTDIDNLQWVSSVYNRAKFDMTDEEFNTKYELRYKG